MARRVVTKYHAINVLVVGSREVLLLNAQSKELLMVSNPDSFKSFLKRDKSSGKNQAIYI